jgi:hypothetical protein
MGVLSFWKILMWCLMWLHRAWLCLRGFGSKDDESHYLVSWTFYGVTHPRQHGVCCHNKSHFALDPALIRDGRFVKIELGTCDKDMLQSMFKSSSIASFLTAFWIDSRRQTYTSDFDDPPSEVCQVTDVKCSDADILEPFLHNVWRPFGRYTFLMRWKWTSTRNHGDCKDATTRHIE